MRRFSSLLSWILLPVAIAVVIAIATGQPPIAWSPSVSSASTGALSTAQTTFANFPLDTPRTIDFELDGNTMSQLTPREQGDQQRDWLLYTVLAASGVSADAFNRILYDVAPVRHGYLRHVSRFEYGATRSCVMGDNQVIALVPKANAKQRADDVAHIFDEARKNLGAVPAELTLFEYSLVTRERATVTRRASIMGRSLLEAAAGYQEASVSSIDDLEKFMASVDDLVLVRNDGGVLNLGGRKLTTAQYRNIGVEDVAAIWQAEAKIHADLREFDARWEQRAQEFNRSWNSSHRHGTRSEYDKAFDTEVQQPHDEERANLHLVGGSGFSLDPEYNFKGLAEALSKTSFVQLEGDEHSTKRRKGITSGSADKVLTVAKLLQSAQIPEAELDRAIAAIKAEAVADPEADISLSRSAIDFANLLGVSKRRITPGKPNILPFLELQAHTTQLAREGNKAAALLHTVLHDFDVKYRFQAARYDGPLAGTQVGMVLFYTDLLAKLWALDYLGSTPTRTVDEFDPITRIILPTIYRAEQIELPNTRLWFGPEDNGYQIVGGNMLYLARRSTRIYSASSNPLEPGKEVAPNASSEAFLGWWNDHFDEVAAYEPQYQRLNEIMKWSLVISWLNHEGLSKSLGFLSQAHVDTSAWFPEWARKGTELRFQDWEKVDFFERGHVGTHTEAMPILVSYHHKSFADEDEPYWTLEGGVSLGSKDLFKARVPLSQELPSVMRRSGVDYKALHGSNELETFRGARYNLSATETAAVTGTRGVGRELATIQMSAKSGLKYRARFGEMSEGRFERVVEEAGSNTRIEARTAVGEIGHLNIAPSRNGFRVGWRASEVDDGYAIARRLSSSTDFAAELKTNPLVEAAIVDGDTGAVYVRSQGARKWMKLAPEGNPSPDVAKGWDARVADIVPEARPVNIAWLDEAQVPTHLRDSGNWVRGPPRGSSGTSLSPEFHGDEIREATKAILSDPATYKLKLDARFKKNLAEIDQLLREGQSGKALGRIEEGFGEFGRHEQLHFRQALAELADGRSDAAADAINAIAFVERDQAISLIDEINSRLKAGDDLSLRRFAESADWRTSTGKPIDDEVLLIAKQDGKLDHELRLSRPPQGSTISPEAVPADAEIYIQDTPGLNSMDWNTSVKASLDQLADMHLGHVIELPRADIAHFNPASISSGKTKFSRAGKFSSAPSSYTAHSTTLYRTWPTATSGSDDDDEEKDENGLPRNRAVKIYLVIAASAEA